MEPQVWILSKPAFDRFLKRAAKKSERVLKWSYTDLWYQGNLMYRVVIERGEII